MKIITANVNGIRAAQRKGFFDYIQHSNADIVCLQEIKAQEDQLDDKFYPNNWHCFYHPAVKKGYSGTAILAKPKPDKVIKSTNWADIDQEGRFIQADFGSLSIISLYLPSGSSKQERQDFKMEFLTKRLMPYLKNLQTNNRHYIIAGDWNIVHKEIDIKNFNSNKNRSGCLPQERAWMNELFGKAGFVDAFRVINSQKHQYTWWSNRRQAWANNTGWRIDYQVISPSLADKVNSVEIYKQQRFSDHAPLIIDYQYIL